MDKTLILELFILFIKVIIFLSNFLLKPIPKIASTIRSYFLKKKFFFIQFLFLINLRAFFESLVFGKPRGKYKSTLIFLFINLVAIKIPSPPLLPKPHKINILLKVNY